MSGSNVALYVSIGHSRIWLVVALLSTKRHGHKSKEWFKSSMLKQHYHQHEQLISYAHFQRPTSLCQDTDENTRITATHTVAAVAGFSPVPDTSTLELLLARSCSTWALNAATWACRSDPAFVWAWGGFVGVGEDDFCGWVGEVEGGYADFERGLGGILYEGRRVSGQSARERKKVKLPCARMLPGGWYRVLEGYLNTVPLHTNWSS
jgi:hypothetical protein